LDTVPAQVSSGPATLTLRVSAEGAAGERHDEKQASVVVVT
jgi:hypothetical protein